MLPFFLLHQLLCLFFFFFQTNLLLHFFSPLRRHQLWFVSVWFDMSHVTDCAETKHFLSFREGSRQRARARYDSLGAKCRYCSCNFSMVCWKKVEGKLFISITCMAGSRSVLDTPSHSINIRAINMQDGRSYLRTTTCDFQVCVCVCALPWRGGKWFSKECAWELTWIWGNWNKCSL